MEQRKVGGRERGAAVHAAQLGQSGDGRHDLLRLGRLDVDGDAADGEGLLAGHGVGRRHGLGGVAAERDNNILLVNGQRAEKMREEVEGGAEWNGGGRFL